MFFDPPQWVWGMLADNPQGLREEGEIDFSTIAHGLNEALEFMQEIVDIIEIHE